jgi:hypothetical protein
MSTFAPHEVVFDEAGNTGADLLNSDQPVFSLASVLLTQAEADQILSPIRTPQTGELKFSRLKRSDFGRRRLIELLTSPALNSENVALSLFHKRFAAIAKVVDLLIEPLAHRDGHDFFKQGFNLSYCNLLFVCLPVYFGVDSVDRLLAAFINMFRQRTTASVGSFYAIAHDLFDEHSGSEIAGPFAPVVASERMIGEILRYNDKLALDPAIPAFFQQCATWGERLGGPFRVVHDDSKPIFQDKEALESLMAPGEEGQRIGYDRRTFVFPLRAEGIRFAPSAGDPRLQVADLIASSAAHWAASRIPPTRQTTFTEELAAARLDRFLVDGIWPTSAISPAELGTEGEGGIDALEHMTEFLSKKRN